MKVLNGSHALVCIHNHNNLVTYMAVMNTLRKWLFDQMPQHHYNNCVIKCYNRDRRHIILCIYTPVALYMYT